MNRRLFVFVATTVVLMSPPAYAEVKKAETKKGTNPPAGSRGGPEGFGGGQTIMTSTSQKASKQKVGPTENPAQPQKGKAAPKIEKEFKKPSPPSGSTKGGVQTEKKKGWFSKK